MASDPQYLVRSRTDEFLVADDDSVSSILNSAFADSEGNPLNSNASNRKSLPSPRDSTDPVNAESAPTLPLQCLFEATTNTPIRSSSSRTGGGQSRASKANKSGGSRATHSRIYVPEVTPQAKKQPVMDGLIEEEMRGAILHNPKFIEHFLSGDSGRLDRVVERCRSAEAFDQEKNGWKLPVKIARESVLYKPVRNILNAIKHAVDHTENLGENLNDQGSSYHEAGSETDSSASTNADPDDVSISTKFQDTSKTSIPSDDADTVDLKPDLSLFEHVNHKNWETMRMPIEIKKLAGYHKHGMKQLSRYARAVFAHQIHRRHLYGLMVCGTEATFVRFDRAGILYSRRVDIRIQSEAFTRALASLLMLDRADQGYDTAFTTELNSDGRWEYYIDLPQSVFEDATHVPVMDPSEGRGSSGLKPSKRRFKVLRKLCHRKSIRGRATIVLHVREVPERGMGDRKAREGDEADDPNLEEYVLKIIWRDPKRESEGEVLEQVKGVYGLAQHVWHCDVPGRCRCSPQTEVECSDCVDDTVQVEELEVCDNLKDISVYVPVEDKDELEDPVLEYIDTTQLRSVSHGRKRRIYSYILMSSVGTPLLEADNPHQFMTVVLDAILGYWQLVNIGVLHRDISYGNVMMLHGKQEFERKTCIEGQSEKPKVVDPNLEESKVELQDILIKLNRNPTGMLSDFDLHAKHSSPALPEVQVGPAGATVSRPAKRSLDPGTSDFSPDGLELPSKEGSVVEMPMWKRRRTNSGSSKAVSCATPKTPSLPSTSSHPESSQPEDGKQELIDFRTGTPAFMSLRVLAVDPGTPYYHSFLDDLQSFFWLVFWCAAAHLDNGSNPTQKAQKELDSMDQCDLDALANWKRSKLTQCVQDSGREMKNLLKSFKNKWASHSIFINVIIRLGRLFSMLHYNSLSNTTPATIFLKVTNIILTELGRVK